MLTSVDWCTFARDSVSPAYKTVYIDWSEIVDKIVTSLNSPESHLVYDKYGSMTRMDMITGVTVCCSTFGIDDFMWSVEWSVIDTLASERTRGTVCDSFDSC